MAIDTLYVKGYVHELVVRFAKDADYYLDYGKKDGTKPLYDIHHFADKIPDILTTVALGKEEAIEKKEQQTMGPLFQNKAWLWAAMTVIILSLGWFSIKMMRS